jgi:hypothetical protein
MRIGRCNMHRCKSVMHDDVDVSSSDLQRIADDDDADVCSSCASASRTPCSCPLQRSYMSPPSPCLQAISCLSGRRRMTSTRHAVDDRFGDSNIVPRRPGDDRVRSRPMSMSRRDAVSLKSRPSIWLVTCLLCCLPVDSESAPPVFSGECTAEVFIALYI